MKLHMTRRLSNGRLSNDAPHFLVKNPFSIIQGGGRSRNLYTQIHKNIGCQTTLKTRFPQKRPSSPALPQCFPQASHMLPPRLHYPSTPIFTTARHNFCALTRYPHLTLHILDPSRFRPLPLSRLRRNLSLSEELHVQILRRNLSLSDSVGLRFLLRL